MPLLPGIVILLAYWIETSFRNIAIVAVSLVALMIAGHAIASRTVFPRYDLRPVVAFLKDYQGREWAFVRKYFGELTYLGRLEKPIASESLATIDDWFNAHPDGIAIIRYDKAKSVENYQTLFEMPYRGKRIGVFKKK